MEIDMEEMDFGLEASLKIPDSIFKVKKVYRVEDGQIFETGDDDSESSGYAHYYKCSQKSLKIGTLINPEAGDLTSKSHKYTKSA